VNGIYLSYTEKCSVGNNTSSYNTQAGYKVVNGSTGNTLTGNIGNNNTDHGFEIESSYNTLTANKAKGNTKEGFIFLSTVGMTITDNQATGNLEAGIDLRGVQYSTINNNSAMNQGTSESHKAGIRLVDNGSDYCLYNTVSGNVSSDNQDIHTQSRGIEELGNSNYNIFTSNICLNNTDGQLSTVGANDIVDNNIVA
jgi:parallel beta-helix repeat protein